MIAEVIVDIAANETDRIFDYLCDDTLIVGSRVRAPFGNKTLPKWLVVDKEKATAKLVSLPARDDIDFEINKQYIVEFYSK